jgi:ubiquinone/menaquinone biosynthesis C-methylase UbiE
MPDPHPFFATVFASVAALGERTGYGPRRAEALAGATGRLLIVGLGPGHDLEHLPGTVTDVVAVEPEPTMRRYCARRVDRSPVPTRLVAAVAEELPLPDECMDAALVALVLCSVTNPAAAAAELRRVLRPTGTLHVLEHVHAPPGSRLARWQHRLDPLWSSLAAGCHVTRDTRQVLRTAGFETSRLRTATVRLAPPLVVPHVVGSTCRARPSMSDKQS